jgi:hypothetical protein
MSIARTLIKLREFNIVSVESLPYGHPSATTANVKQALDWIFAVLYPNTKPSVSTVGDLPLIGNDLNDYRVVLDDGDGKAAGYRWEEREGDPAPKWYKIHDMDWSSDAILASFLDATQDKYVHKGGRMDLDADGNPITGLRAGQTVHGGTDSGSNLTLSPNSGDGTGPQSGYVQFDGNSRPTSDDTFDLGSAGERFRDIFFNGQITDGAISLSLADLDAAFDHSQITNDNPHNTSYDQLSNKLGTLTLNGDVSGSADLSTSGDKTITVTVANDSHTHNAASTITNFDSEVYEYLKVGLQDNDGLTFVFDDGLETVTPELEISTDVISDIDGPVTNSILVSDVAGTKWKPSSGTIELTGDVSGTATFSSISDKWSITTTVDSSSLSGVEEVTLDNKVWASTPGAPTVITAMSHGLQTGESVRLFGSDITGEKLVTVIDQNTFSIPDASIAPDSGHYIPQGGQLLYNTSSGKFQVAKEYEEIFLSELSGLNQDVLSQYVNINGRSGGQNVQGGVSAGESLILESTASASKGTVQTKDTFTPFTDASYAGSWSGMDLGSPSRRWRDLYMSGEAFGLRAENVASLPMASGTSVGRMVFYNGQLHTNNGTSWNSAGAAAVNHVVFYLSGNGTQTIFSIPTDPIVAERLSIYINGVYQFKNTYTVSGTTLTFTEAPPVGTNNIEVTVTELQSNPSALADATTTTKGAVRLAGDLGGTADAPTVKKYIEVLNAPIVFGTSGVTSLIGATYFYAPANFTVTKVEVQLFTKGTATTGTLALDVLKASNLQGSPVDYASIMTTAPSIDMSTALDYQIATGVINPAQAAISEGQFIRLDVTSVPAGLQAIHVRVYGF